MPALLTLQPAPGSFSQRMLWLLEERHADHRIASVRYPHPDHPGQQQALP